MSSRPVKKPKLEDEELPWTNDHHLIGNTITRTVLDRSFDNKYQKVATSLPIQYFQPEDAATRKPALWRALYCASSDALACDAISADWQSSSSLGEGDLSAVVKHRLQTVLYQHVVQEWIPPLMTAAILEECQAVLVTHILRQQQQSSSNVTNGASSSSFPYYHQSPNSYLATTHETRMLEDASSTLLPVKLTPGQLVARIKQGCALLWQQQDRHSALVMSNTRSSRRLAQQQQPPPEEKEETNELWQVVPGGKIATYLQEHLIHLDLEDSPEEEVDDDVAEEEDEETDLLANNPYLKLPSDAILEWLGKKTAKLLSSSDLEDAISALIYISPKGKKQPKLSGLDLYQAAPTLDDSLASLIPAALWKFICNLEDAQAQDGDWHYARLSLVSQEDLTADAGQFSRRPFQVKVLWAPEVATRRNDQNAAQVADAQEEAKNARNWATWRHKGIHGGYTVWSSWLQAVEKWQSAQDKGNGKVTLNGTDTVSDPSADRIPSEGDTGKTEISDEQIAKELEAMAGSRRSRRSEKGGGGGVFYGTQSNMTPKQVMDALLRLVSQSKYQTTASLISAVPDESSDPLRRIRGAIGKLLWKRSQLSKLEVQTEWTDAPAWESLKEAGLITVDSTNILDDSIDPSDVTALVNYIRELHRTELRLRRMLLENLTDVPIPVVATAADEKAGSMESMDAVDFEEESAASIQWLASGHDLLNKVIFRPPVSSQIDTIAACEWFRIVDFAEVVESPQVEDPSLQERPQIGLAKESRVVERRRRFRAESVDGGFPERLILTEGQVLAGLKAAQLEEKRKAGDPACPEYKGLRTNPFAGSKYPEIALVAPENSVEQNISGVVAAHDSKVDANGLLVQRILVVPDEGKEFWAALVFADNGSITGRIEGDEAQCDYIVQQFEYHTGSQAYEECRSIVKFLERHVKAGPFLEAVDPVALNIPTYFSVIKNPMDISTLSANLESGKYSTIPPNQTRGRTSVTRMLNGPFRTDVDLIFDNAMLFNPPGDWIHQEASALKKAVTRKFDLAISAAESGGRSQQRQSFYSEYESDVDMYEYESDADDDFVVSGRSRRKRNQSSTQAPVKEDASSRVVERPIRLQKILSEQGVRGSLANMPISTDVSTFSLPPGWSCRARMDEGTAEKSETHQDSNGLDEIIALHAAIEEQEASNVRRSTRTHHEDDAQEKGSNKSRKLEFYDLYSTGSTATVKNRMQVEIECERNHETRYAKLYHKLLKLVECSELGMYAEGSFPPYLGRVVPLSTNYDLNDAGSLQWEIRETYLVPALRWVLRGLIQSEHVHEYESVETAKDSGTILPNHVYYLDPQLEPLDVVDSKELTRRKRATNAAAEESSEEDVELSAYEKMRAERVSRNAERLKALGLA